jgi:gas vesicle protein
MANAVNRYFEGLLVGGALGFIAGLLTAPKPGVELRKDLAESYDDLMRQAGDQFGDIRENVSDRVQPIADRAAIYGERIKSQATDIKDRISDRTVDLREKAGDLREKAGDLREKAGDLLTTARDKAESMTGNGKDLVDNYMGNRSGPMYTPGAKVAPDAAGSSVSDACSNYTANRPEAAGS